MGVFLSWKSVLGPAAHRLLGAAAVTLLFVSSSSCDVIERVAQATTTTGIVPVAIDSSFQPPVTYVRPIKFPTLQLVSNVSMNGNTFTTTAIDVHAYESAIISFVGSNSVCTFVPQITVGAGPLTTGPFTDLSTANSVYTTVGLYSVSSGSYNIQLTQNYVQIQITGVTGLLGVNTCTYSIYLTLVPAVLPTSGATVTQRETNINIGNTAVLSLSSFPGMQSVTIQNQGAKVIACNLTTGGTTSRPVILAAGSVAGDGTGGSATFPAWAGTLYCYTPGMGDTSVLGVLAY